MNKSLTIYKASAGSGKTYTLAIEYIKLLIRDPQSYRKILAVTFTNKATEEMKKRILSQLYGIWKRLPDSDSYVRNICKSLDITPEYVSKQASIALNYLLHNYSYFRIETIDSFFQSILRNLARELDLTPNLRLTLNDKQVEEQAVDKLIEELDSKNEVLFWIIDYINERISDDKSWNVISEIKQFGKTIFKDDYKSSSEDLTFFMTEKGVFEKYVKIIRKEQQESKDMMCSYGKSFMQAISEAGLTDRDFKYGTGGIYGFFAKLTNGVFEEKIVGKRVMDCLDDPKHWYSAKKGTDSSLIHSLIVNKLYNLLAEAVKERPKQWMRYKSAELTLKHINQLRLLNVIERKVRLLNNDENRFLLSDTQHLLQSLIDGNDSPFIYEKIGNYINHIMIDEFQDTSTVQWQNFKILLQNCMSNEDSHNLIVGDVKQSIYRWRSGDWRLLSNISNEFSHSEEMLDIITLDTNYRSQKRIVNFNNVFFKVAKRITNCADVDNAYNDVEQLVPESKGNNGYVKIDVLPHEEYENNTLESLKDFIAELLDKGAKQNEIAIIVRLNEQVALIANYLQEQLHDKDINIVSDEAFRLDSSIAVSIIISALHLLIHTDDNLEKAKLATAYSKLVLGNIQDKSQILTHIDNIDEWLPKEYIDNQAELLKMPLYDLCQHLYMTFNLDKLANESYYIATFNDKLSKFITDKSSDISAFLKEWNENLCNTNIQGTEINGIRLLTIHKSKGLEFENVIIPFCDWKLEKTSGNVLLCDTDIKPFSQLPLIPIDYSSHMEGTAYEDSYHLEQTQNIVDNMNLLYVAFTRAVSNLYVICKKNSTSTRSMLIEQSLSDVSRMLDDAFYVESDNKLEQNSLEYGEVYVKPAKAKSESANVFLQMPANQPLNFTSNKTNVEFRQSNDSLRFTKSDDTDEANDYINQGLILHDILSRIKTADDISKTFAELEHNGVLSEKDIRTIRNMLSKRLAAPKVSEWFTDKWDVINETSIIFVDPDSGNTVEHRPDRVMVRGSEAIVVDFKFGKPKDEYKSQVSQYAELLRQMGYTAVRGYIWYVYTNKIEEV